MLKDAKTAIQDVVTGAFLCSYTPANEINEGGLGEVDCTLVSHACSIVSGDYV